MTGGEPLAEIALGEVIGGYRLERLLGAGSTSQVFLGSHIRLGRQAAIKVLAVQLLMNKDVVARLLTEARVVNDIRHPNIVDILDFVETESPPRVALVMEYIEGPSLKALREWPFTYDQALGIALQLVAAVQAAHAAGVIHRDIKPDNLLLSKDPRNDPAKRVPRLKIVDFGIAKLAGSSGRTMTGMMLGTPAYMAPEQIAGRPAPSAATDVFAIGEVIFELLANKRAYPASTIHETVRAKLRGELPKLELPPVPGATTLLALITRCLAFKQQDRPTLQEVRDTLLSLAPAQDQASARYKQASSSVASVLDPPTAQWLSSLQETVEPSIEVPPVTAPGQDKTQEIVDVEVRDTREDRRLPGELARSPSEHIATMALSAIEAFEDAPPRPRHVPPPAATEVMHHIPHEDTVPTNKVLRGITDPVQVPGTSPSQELVPISGSVPFMETAITELPVSSSEFAVPDVTELGQPQLPQTAESRVIDRGSSDMVRTLDPETDPRVTERDPREDEPISAPSSPSEPSLERELIPPRLRDPAAPSAIMPLERQGLLQPLPPAQSTTSEPRIPVLDTPVARFEAPPTRNDIPARVEPAMSRIESPGARPFQETPSARAPLTPVTPPRRTDPSVERRVHVRRGAPLKTILLIIGLWVVAGSLAMLAFYLREGSNPVQLPGYAQGGPQATRPRPGRVTLHSRPPGARVEVASTNQNLGETPLEIEVAPDAKPLRVRVSSGGYQPVEIDISLASPSVWVDLEPKR
jgi:serine/threonine protein kinase